MSPLRFDLTGHSRETSYYRHAVATAAAALNAGKLVAFPTETVYGLGALLTRPDGLASIFAAKNRPQDNPLIVHVHSLDAARALCREWPQEAETVARTFWPGPLTLVLPRSSSVPDLVTAGLDTVAVRIPAQRVAWDLCAQAGAVAAPSANRSGRPSPTRAEHVLADLGSRVAVLLDDGPCRVGVESTVLDLSGSRPAVLRPGGVPLEPLRRLLGPVELLAEAEWEQDPKLPGPARSPGTRYRHYAPRTPLVLLRGGRPESLRAAAAELLREAGERGRRIGLLAASEVARGLSAAATVDLGPFDRPEEAARRLFQALRELDAKGLDLLVAHSYPLQGHGTAVTNRLVRGATWVRDVDGKQDETQGGNEAGSVANPLNILLVCTGNTCRSPMAAVILRQRLGGDVLPGVEIRSAGTDACEGDPMHPQAAEVLAEAGFPVEEHRSTRLDREDVVWSDVVLTMTEAQKRTILARIPEARGKVFTLSEYADVKDPECEGDVPDPIGGGLDAYRRTRERIDHIAKSLVRRWRKGSTDTEE